MRDEFLIFARYNQEANKAIFSILDKLSNGEREEERGSYYGSLSGLVRHIAGGTAFFLGMFKAPLQKNADAQKAIAAVEGLVISKEKLNDEQWKDLYKVLETGDKAFIALISSLSEADFKAPVPINWYGGNPAEVPLSFMLQNLVAHGTHHRGQISQILDSLKIDNDYSGINAAFLAK
ncbi:MAG: damage-inducible protein DinB [Treponema sp.]|jgi:uncharacterized damage-inducible protein DinB|nr:damage-inducible protein DinB [Treponema sp.]